MKLKVGVLGSTRGTSLQGVLDAIAAGALNVDIALVLSDREGAPILQRAASHGIDAVFLVWTAPPATVAPVLERIAKYALGSYCSPLRSKRHTLSFSSPIRPEPCPNKSSDLLRPQD